MIKLEKQYITTNGDKSGLNFDFSVFAGDSDCSGVISDALKASSCLAECYGLYISGGRK